MALRYLIAGPKDPSTNQQLYWSSRYGWVRIESAEPFAPTDLQFNRLPPGGQWVEDAQAQTN